MDDGMIVVAVDDSGPGVPEDERARIFVEGVSSKAPAGARGPHRRGIGLALVRRVVRRRRGDVSVTDSPLGGARFVVRLPIDAPSPTTSAHEAVPA
ncbi:ATP-binding protein [Microbacterium trichothecenolyticum]